MNRLHRLSRVLRRAALPLAAALLLSGCTLFFDTHPGDPPAEGAVDDSSPDAGNDVGPGADTQTGN